MISRPRNLWSPCLLLDHKPTAVSKTSLYCAGFVSLYFLAPIAKTHIWLCDELGWCELPDIWSKTQHVMNAWVSNSLWQMWSIWQGEKDVPYHKRKEVSALFLFLCFHIPSSESRVSHWMFDAIFRYRQTARRKNPSDEGNLIWIQNQC